MTGEELSCVLVVGWYVVLGGISLTHLRAAKTLGMRLWWSLLCLFNLAGIILFMALGLWLDTFREMGVLPH